MELNSAIKRFAVRAHVNSVVKSSEADEVKIEIFLGNGRENVCVSGAARHDVGTPRIGERFYRALKVGKRYVVYVACVHAGSVGSPFALLSELSGKAVVFNALTEDVAHLVRFDIFLSPASFA